MARVTSAFLARLAFRRPLGLRFVPEPGLVAAAALRHDTRCAEHGSRTRIPQEVRVERVGIRIEDTFAEWRMRALCTPFFVARFWPDYGWRYASTLMVLANFQIECCKARHQLLEFVGDSCLKLLQSFHLFHALPNASMGHLSLARVACERNAPRSFRNQRLFDRIGGEKPMWEAI